MIGWRLGEVDGLLQPAVLGQLGRRCSSVALHVDADRVVAPLGLVDREEDGLAADGEVAALGVALVVLGHEDAAQVGVAGEDHAEHVVDLALLVVGRRPVGRDRRDLGRVERHAQLHRHAVDRVMSSSSYCTPRRGSSG